MPEKQVNEYSLENKQSFDHIILRMSIILLDNSSQMLSYKSKLSYEVRYPQVPEEREIVYSVLYDVMWINQGSSYPYSVEEEAAAEIGQSYL